jgi:hypothetical protein
MRRSIYIGMLAFASVVRGCGPSLTRLAVPVVPTPQPRPNQASPPTRATGDPIENCDQEYGDQRRRFNGPDECRASASNPDGTHARYCRAWSIGYYWQRDAAYRRALEAETEEHEQIVHFIQTRLEVLSQQQAYSVVIADTIGEMSERAIRTRIRSITPLVRRHQLTAKTLNALSRASQQCRQCPASQRIGFESYLTRMRTLLVPGQPVPTSLCDPESVSEDFVSRYRQYQDSMSEIRTFGALMCMGRPLDDCRPTYEEASVEYRYLICDTMQGFVNRAYLAMASLTNDQRSARTRLRAEIRARILADLANAARRPAENEPLPDAGDASRNNSPVEELARVDGRLRTALRSNALADTLALFQLSDDEVLALVGALQNRFTFEDYRAGELEALRFVSGSPGQ